MLSSYQLRSSIETAIYRCLVLDREQRLRAKKENKLLIPFPAGSPPLACELLWEKKHSWLLLLPPLMPRFSLPPPPLEEKEPWMVPFYRRKLMEWEWVARVWSDAAERKRLMAHPKSVLEEWMGELLPSGWEVEIREEGSALQCVVPYLPTECSLDDLEGLNEASGWQLHHAELHAFKVIGGAHWTTPVERLIL